jgi:hypothetical protein
MLNKLEFKKVRDFGETINDTFQFVKQNFRPLMKVYFYICGFFIIGTMISTTIHQLNMQEMAKAAGPFKGFAAFQSMLTIQYGFTILVGIASYTAMIVTVLSFIAIYVEKDKVSPTVEQVWAYFKYYYLRALAGNILLSMFLVICMLPCGIAFIYVFPAMSIFFPVMIFENGSVSFSFSRSFKLITNNWGLIAGSMIIIAIITYATMSFASIPTVILALAGAFVSGSKSLSLSAIIMSGILQSLCQIFLILPLVCSAICYFNLRERHENIGLLSRINEMGETKDKADFTEEY